MVTTGCCRARSPARCAADAPAGGPCWARAPAAPSCGGRWPCRPPRSQRRACQRRPRSTIVLEPMANKVSPSNGRLCWSGSRFSDFAPKVARRICASSRSSRARASSTSARRVSASMRAASAAASRRSRSATRAAPILLDAMARGYPTTPCLACRNSRPSHPAAAIPPAADAAAARLGQLSNPNPRTARKNCAGESRSTPSDGFGQWNAPPSSFLWSEGRARHRSERRPEPRARSGPTPGTSPRRGVSIGTGTTPRCRGHAPARSARSARGRRAPCGNRPAASPDTLA